MVKLLREYIQRMILSERLFDQVARSKFLVRVTASKKIRLIDVYTGIRGIVGVITVTQIGESHPGPEGKSVSLIDVSYDTNRISDPSKLRRKIRRVEGVDMVLVKDD